MRCTDFSPPGAAFMLLGIVALATLAAALLHGPALAGLGLVGAFSRRCWSPPSEPNYWALYVYLARRHRRRLRAGAHAAVALARHHGRRVQRALDASRLAMIRVSTRSARMSSMSSSALRWPRRSSSSGLLYGPTAEPGHIDAVSSGALPPIWSPPRSSFASGHDPLALVVLRVLAAATVAIAWRAEAAAGGGAGRRRCLPRWSLPHWAVDVNFDTLLRRRPSPRRRSRAAEANVGSHLALGGGFAALFGGAGFLAQGRSRARDRRRWCGRDRAVLAPIAILIALYYRIAGIRALDPVRRHGAAARRALCGSPPRRCNRREPRPGLAAATRDLRHRRDRRAGAGAHLRAGERLAHRGAGADGAGHRLGRRQAAAAALRCARRRHRSCVVLLRIGCEPRIVGRDVGTTPIFNWLLYGYGVPAASFWLGGYLLRRRADDVPGAHGRRRGDPVHGAARLPRDPPLHERRRRLPPSDGAYRSRAAGRGRAGDDHRARTAPRCAPTASCTMSAR